MLLYTRSVLLLATSAMLTCGRHMVTHEAPWSEYTLHYNTTEPVPRVLPVVENPPLALMECPTSKCYCDTLLQNQEPIVNCLSKQLQEIPTFTKVDTVYFEIRFESGNYIRTLANHSFANLKVKRINLLGNQLSDIQPLAFHGIELYLQELLIEGNGQMSIPYDRLIHLTNLRRLRIENFHQTKASENKYFEHFPNLESLEVANIDAFKIDDSTFHGNLPKLINLQLQNVHLNSIPVQGLSILSRLQRLQVTNNKRLESILSGSFEQLRALTKLDLSHNDIKNIEADAFIGITQNLKELKLSSNYLTLDAMSSLSTKSWRSLEYLSLSHNSGFTTFPDHVFKNMPSLQYLLMIGMNLKTLSKTLLTGLTNLHALSLGYNDISTIDDTAFFENTRLNQVHLDFQFDTSPGTLQISPTAFRRLETSLTELNLQNTMVESDGLWKTLPYLKVIKKLILRGTKLNVIPAGAFQSNSKLWTLDLQENNIRTLSQTVFKGLKDSLEEVSLESNSLETISECVFKNFSRLRSIRLRENPLNCDCKLRWLYKFLHEVADKEKLFLKEEYKCSKPAANALKYLYDLSENAVCNTVHVPDLCIETPIQSSTIPTTTTKPSSYGLKMNIASKTQDSITVAWSVNDHSHITGYKLEYSLTTDPHSKRVVSLHRDQIFHVLTNLLPGMFYKIVLYAEVNQQWDVEGRQQQTTQTTSGSNNQQGHGQRPGDNSGESRNIIIGAIIAALAVVVLISVGVCAVIKYKYKLRSLQEVQLSLASPNMRRHPNYGGEDMVVCTVPNEYMEINNARLGTKYVTNSPLMVHRQLGLVEGIESPYSTYHRIRGRRNPYENDDEENIIVNDPGMGKSDEMLFKPDLEERHSAPSRLAATDLGKTGGDRNSRPLPARPSNQLDPDENRKSRSHTLQAKRGKNKDTNRVQANAESYDTAEIPEYSKVNRKKTNVDNKSRDGDA